jgi:hypothetical protein
VQVVVALCQFQAAGKGRMDFLGVALREHQGDAERGLKLHLLALVGNLRIKPRQRLSCPVMAFRQQRKLEKELGGCRGKRYSNHAVALLGEAPIQGGADIGEMIRIGSEAVAGREACGSRGDACKEIAEIDRVVARYPYRFAAFRKLFRGEGARGIQQSIAYRLSR